MTTEVNEETIFRALVAAGINQANQEKIANGLIKSRCRNAEEFDKEWMNYRMAVVHEVAVRTEENSEWRNGYDPEWRTPTRRRSLVDWLSWDFSFSNFWVKFFK